MMLEKWDILDSNGALTGKTALRGGNTLKSGEYHLVVHIWIVSSDNRVLIQRRSPNKKHMPGEWAATGGAAVSGENSFEAASRELFEELGIKSDEQNLKKLLRLKRRNSWLDVWFIECNTPAEKLVLQASEVAEAKWVSREELDRMIENGEFHNYGKEYFSNVYEKIDSLRGALV
ncbi:MAG: NUDIX domain-containing protein [Acutalibacteraceae bacterium]|nr:NUDIX domain-containing protein [Acutalibacteraceae bacterium]